MPNDKCPQCLGISATTNINCDLCNNTGTRQPLRAIDAVHVPMQALSTTLLPLKLRVQFGGYYIELEGRMLQGTYSLHDAAILVHAALVQALGKDVPAFHTVTQHHTYETTDERRRI